jgi:hypothetical protein
VFRDGDPQSREEGRRRLQGHIDARLLPLPTTPRP